MAPHHWSVCPNFDPQGLEDRCPDCSDAKELLPEPRIVYHEGLGKWEAFCEGYPHTHLMSGTCLYRGPSREAAELAAELARDMTYGERRALGVRIED